MENTGGPKRPPVAPGALTAKYQRFIEKLQEQLRKELAKIGNSAPSGDYANSDPAEYMALTEKFIQVLQKAPASDKLSDQVKEKLAALLRPENVAALTAFIAAYAAIHGTPLAPFLLVADVGMAAAGGTEAALAIFEVFLALDSATTQDELEQAEQLMIDKLSGPMADAIVKILTLGAGCHWRGP